MKKIIVLLMLISLFSFGYAKSEMTRMERVRADYSYTPMELSESDIAYIDQSEKDIEEMMKLSIIAQKKIARENFALDLIRFSLLGALAIGGFQQNSSYGNICGVIFSFNLLVFEF